jgi:drug/metabolite transporter (DMT)-like permease
MHASQPRVHRPFLSRQEIILLLITMIWGVTFLIVRIAMEVSGPFFFVGLRFITAGLVMMLVFGRAMRGVTRFELLGGAWIGVLIFVGYSSQTWGLQTITSSTSAFITALYVPFVPLLQWLVLRRPPRLMSWLGIAFAFTGLILMTGREAGALHFTPGEIATVLCAVAVAGEIILIGHYAGRVDSRRITVIQLLVAGLLSFAAMPVTGEPLPGFSWLLVASGVGLGLATAAIQLAMNWAQGSISPTRATLIYAGESVWAGLVGRLAGDRLPGLALVGAALILTGVVVSDLRWGRSRRERDAIASD